MDKIHCTSCHRRKAFEDIGALDATIAERLITIVLNTERKDVSISKKARGEE